MFRAWPIKVLIFPFSISEICDLFFLETRRTNSRLFRFRSTNSTIFPRIIDKICNFSVPDQLNLRFSALYRKNSLFLRIWFTKIAIFFHDTSTNFAIFRTRLAKNLRFFRALSTKFKIFRALSTKFANFPRPINEIQDLPEPHHKIRDFSVFVRRNLQFFCVLSTEFAIFPCVIN